MSFSEPNWCPIEEKAKDEEEIIPPSFSFDDYMPGASVSSSRASFQPTELRFFLFFACCVLNRPLSAHSIHGRLLHRHVQCRMEIYWAPFGHFAFRYRRTRAPINGMVTS